jgi:hypothetical protein
MNPIALRLSEMAVSLEGSGMPEIVAALEIAEREINRLDELINTPHTAAFLEAVRLEAAHQRERWAADHDAGKTDADWFWLVGYLAGKALHKQDRQVYHIITTAAALLNWHAAKTGADTRMRPGIDPAKHVPTGDQHG